MFDLGAANSSLERRTGGGGGGGGQTDGRRGAEGTDGTRPNSRVATKRAPSACCGSRDEEEDARYFALRFWAGTAYVDLPPSPAGSPPCLSLLLPPPTFCRNTPPPGATTSIKLGIFNFACFLTASPDQGAAGGVRARRFTTVWGEGVLLKRFISSPNIWGGGEGDY